MKYTHKIKEEESESHVIFLTFQAPHIIACSHVRDVIGQVEYILRL